MSIWKTQPVYRGRNGDAFTVTLWLSSGQVIKNLAIYAGGADGFKNTDRYLTGQIHTGRYRTTGLSNQNICSFRWSQIIGLEINWT